MAAVHRLDGEPALVLGLIAADCGEHVLAIPAPCPESPQRLVEQSAARSPRLIAFEDRRRM